jgi:2-polyprenyl-6-methoxyphenol hydroxylase-like FAD-dependent oxidoreductase
VAIVGAGIGGAVLALALGRKGWHVTVLEREPHAATAISRPEILWGATPAALDRFEVGEVIRTQASIRIAGIEAIEGTRRLVGVSQAELDQAGVEPYSTDPAATRALIVGAAQATGNVQVVRSAEVRELVRNGSKVCGVRGTCNGEPFEVRARLVVGDDGGHSVVRQGLGISLATRMFPFDLVTALILWPEDLPPDRVRLWAHLAALRSGIPFIGFIPRPEAKGALLMPLPHARAERIFASSGEAFWGELAKLTPQAGFLRSQLRFPSDFVRIRRPYGHAPRYVADGAAILGDAAHPVSPAGGQGANASIWDALALAEVAHEALTVGDASRDKLARYEVLRRPANERSVAITRRVVRGITLLRPLPGLPWLVPLALGAFDRLPALKRSLLGTFATTFITR